MVSPPSRPSAALEDRRLDYERNLMEADRMTMQTVQTSLSLMGVGFTITTFFTDVADRLGAPGGGGGARVLGASMLVIGLLLLGLGTWSQARYRRDLRRRYADVWPASKDWTGLQARFTPSFIASVLLLVTGLFGLASMLVRWLL